MTFLAVLLPLLALAALLANWLILRDVRKRHPNATRREKVYYVVHAWSTAGLSLSTEAREKAPTYLESAMQSVWLHGNWRSLTRNMTTPEKEAAWAAVKKCSDPDDPPEDKNWCWWRDDYVEH